MDEREDAAERGLRKNTRDALLLRREDAALALREAQRNPWLCAGLDSSILPAMLEAPPLWLPKQGERLALGSTTLLVLRRAQVQPQTLWPWLLCAQEKTQAANVVERPSSLGALAAFSRRIFIYCSLLSWKAGRSTTCVDELGNPLRLIPAIDLARAAMAMRTAPKLSAFRAARHAPSPARLEHIDSPNELAAQ